MKSAMFGKWGLIIFSSDTPAMLHLVPILTLVMITEKESSTSWSNGINRPFFSVSIERSNQNTYIIQSVERAHR